MTPETDAEHADVNVEGLRKSVFSQIGHVLIVSREIFDRERLSLKDKLAVGRLIVSASEAAGRILLGMELHELEARVSRLEGKSVHSDEK